MSVILKRHPIQSRGAYNPTRRTFVRALTIALLQSESRISPNIAIQTLQQEYDVRHSTGPGLLMKLALTSQLSPSLTQKTEALSLTSLITIQSPFQFTMTRMYTPRENDGYIHNNPNPFILNINK